jgi:hypothetical protein
MDLRSWKEGRKKTVTLKSGLEVLVRQLSPIRLGELGPIPYLEQATPESQILTAKAIILAGVISPKIGDGDDELSIYDLAISDINELVETISTLGSRPESLPLAEGGSSTETPPSS